MEHAGSNGSSPRPRVLRVDNVFGIATISTTQSALLAHDVASGEDLLDVALGPFVVRWDVVRRRRVHVAQVATDCIYTMARSGDDVWPVSGTGDGDGAASAPPREALLAATSAGGELCVWRDGWREELCKVDMVDERAHLITSLVWLGDVLVCCCRLGMGSTDGTLYAFRVQRGGGEGEHAAAKAHLQQLWVRRGDYWGVVRCGARVLASGSHYDATCGRPLLVLEEINAQDGTTHAQHFPPAPDIATPTSPVSPTALTPTPSAIGRTPADVAAMRSVTVTCMVESARGDLVAVATRDGVVRCMRTDAAGDVLWCTRARRHGRVVSMAFHHDKQDAATELAVCSDSGTLAFIDVLSGEITHRWRSAQLDGVDVKLVLPGHRGDDVFLCTDFELVHCSLTTPSRGTVLLVHDICGSAVGVGPAGQFFATGGMGTVAVWGTEGVHEHAGLPIAMTSAPTSLVRDIHFLTPDVLLFAMDEGSLWRWAWRAPNNPPPERVYAQPGTAITCIACNNTSLVALSCSTRTTGDVVLLDSATWAPPVCEFRAHPCEIWSLAFSPDGARLVTGSEDGTARVWSLADGSLVSTLAHHTMAVTGVDWRSTAVGGLVVTSSDDRRVHVYDDVCFEPRFGVGGLPTEQDDLYVTYTRVHPTAPRVACVTENGYVYVFCLLDGRRMHRSKLHVGSCEGLEWTADGRLVSMGSDCLAVMMSIVDDDDGAQCCGAGPRAGPEQAAGGVPVDGALLQGAENVGDTHAQVVQA